VDFRIFFKFLNVDKVCFREEEDVTTLSFPYSLRGIIGEEFLIFEEMFAVAAAVAVAISVVVSVAVAFAIFVIVGKEDDDFVDNEVGVSKGFDAVAKQVDKVVLFIGKVVVDVSADKEVAKVVGAAKEENGVRFEFGFVAVVLVDHGVWEVRKEDNGVDDSE